MQVLETGGLGLKYDGHPFELSLTAIDRLPVNLHAGNSPLEAFVAWEQLLALILNKLVDQSATVGWWDFVHRSLDRALVSSKFGQIVLEVLDSDVLLLSFDILPGIGVLSFLKCE
jgi:hypothetical protein